MDPHLSASGYSDEIDLFDLFDDIKQKWYWLIGSGFVCVFLSALYAFLATPTYKADFVFKPVSDADLIQLNQPRLKDVFDVPADELFLTPEKAFKAVRTTVFSGSVMRDFYSSLLESVSSDLVTLIYNDKLSLEQNFSNFSDRFSMIDPSARQDDVFLKVSFELSEAALAASVLNQFSQFVIDRHHTDTRESIEKRIELKLEQWNIQAEEMRNKYQAEKKRQIFSLQESAAIAASLNQKRPLYDAERVSVGAQPPLFMMGETALRSEIEQLNSRTAENEVYYVPDLPELMWKIRSVEGTKIAWSNIKYVVVDQPAITPRSAVKPRKLLILALGAVVGGMLGIMFALATAAYDRRKNRQLV
ncbi:MAG: LPS O-antigen chain length determinant protein WzzB [Bacterioplanes sp.]|nr:LPS O-antigen chain length determinant protein WzzB [Bacterioplanes sp.]